MEIAIDAFVIAVRFAGFALSVGVYLLCIKDSRKNPALVSLGFLSAAVGGLCLFGAG